MLMSESQPPSPGISAKVNVINCVIVVMSQFKLRTLLSILGIRLVSGRNAVMIQEHAGMPRF